MVPVHKLYVPNYTEKSNRINDIKSYYKCLGEVTRGKTPLNLWYCKGK